MKAIKLFFPVLFFIFTFSFSNAQSWLWARQGNIINTGDGSEGLAVAADISGDSYLVGYYSGDTLIFGTDTLIYLGGIFETFLVKYSPLGNVLWAKQSTTPSPNSYGYGYSVATDLSGNSYITGYFVDTIAFGSYSLKSNGGCFLAKYSPNGTVLWAKQAIGASARSLGYGQSVCTDKNSDGFITGSFEDTISFGAFRLTQRHNTEGIFIAKYDSNGNIQWATQAVNYSNTANGAGLGISSDKKGNIYITGHFSDTTSFGADKLITTNSWYDNGDVFLVKYNSIGNVLWAKQAVISSSNSYGIGYAVTTDKLFNVYITGEFKDTLTIGTKKLVSNSHSFRGDVFIAKLDSDGNTIWAESADILDSTSWAGYAVSIDTNENLYLSAGAFSSGAHEYRIAFGADTFKTYVGTEDGASLIMKLDTSGKLLCGSIVAGGGDDNNGIAVDPSGNNIYFGGDLLNTVVFNQDTLTDPPFHEFPFMAKWRANCSTSEGITQINPPTESITLFPNPNNGRFEIQLKSQESQPIVEIYNMLGEKVYNATLNPPSGGQSDNTIDISSQPNGIYLYRALKKDGELIGSGKVIIQR